ncbi:MAG: isocitrate/isopropylmalate dehydrogenase family protein [Deltaproteobacteria bacterium]|nr:isocitrate/isopropylmalate dehydrogenase family protein [Deltaproteobacteria bacterium]
MSHRVTLLYGDGIGPEVIDAAVRVIEATGVDITWEAVDAGQVALQKVGVPLPPPVLDSIRRNRVALKGPMMTPIAEGFPSINVALRKELGLYANLRPTKSLPGVPAPARDVDVVVVRENTESLYAGIEHTVSRGVVESVKVITEEASTRIARFAFEYARREGRRKVTAIHKANIMKLSDGLFLDCARRIAREYPEVAYEEKLVDSACMQLVLSPHLFDVLLLENLYGDIVSDLCAGLVGGLGVVPGANLGDEYAVFEAVHGTAPDIAGRNLANPVAAILSGALMLAHLGEPAASRRVVDAVRHVIQSMWTKDLGGTATTAEMRDAIIAQVSALRAPKGE